MAEGILIRAARADTVRRRRNVTRILMRVVPAVCGALLVTAALVRLAHLPLATFWMAVAAAVAGVAVAAWFNGRTPVVDDAAAARLDADAELGGELRSAHWFASHPASNPWTDYHLERAAGRLESVSWTAVYPPLKTARAFAGSAVLALAAVALVLTSAWPAARTTVVPGGVTDDSPALVTTRLPVDLQKQIDDLLKAVQAGTIPMDVARAKVNELRNALADLNPKLQDALAKAAQAQSQKQGNTGSPSTDPKAADLASRAKDAADDGTLPKDMQWSMEDLAQKLANASQNGEPADKSNTGQDSQNSKAGEKPGGAAKMEAAGVQMTRSTESDAQSNQMMASMMSPMGSEKGANGPNDKKGRLGAPLDLAAMRKETVEADADSQGANVLAEMRRKSEQSHATIAFSHVAPLATYDKSHAAPPPAPPDALRALVQQYFIRR
jgi:hypothetical protein